MRSAIILACMLSLTISGSLTESNQQCKWRGLHDCPIYSSGSSPICDNTIPKEISPGKYSMLICASQTPKAIGGGFDVGVAVNGPILTVDVIPQEDSSNNINCSSGEGSVGSRVFAARCDVKDQRVLGHHLYSVEGRTIAHINCERVIQLYLVLKNCKKDVLLPSL